MTDQHDDGASDEPITPEVVRPRGAAGRKRRGDETPLPPDEHPDGAGGPLGATGDAVGPGRPGLMVRLGCMLLIALGLMQLFLSSQWALDPEGARCTQARFAIDAANDDDEDFNDVALPDDIDDVDDLPCDQAIVLAANIPDEEGEEPDGSFPSASQFRTQGIGITVLGLAQATTGLLVLRTRKRGFRIAALVTAALGIVLPVLGIISLAVLAFVVFALGFSRDAKAIWGGGGFLRPRPSPGAG